MSGSAYLLRRAADELHRYVAASRSKPSYRSMEREAKAMLDGMDFAAFWLTDRANEQRAEDRLRERGLRRQPSCSVCGKRVHAGWNLDASGRCLDCQP